MIRSGELRWLCRLIKTQKTLMLVILRYFNFVLFLYPQIVTLTRTKSVQTVPTVLYWDLMACATTFVQSLHTSQKVHTCTRSVQYSQMRSCSLLLCCCSVWFRIALCCKEKLWKEDLAQRSALFYTSFMHSSSIDMCPDHISTGSVSLLFPSSSYRTSKAL